MEFTVEAFVIGDQLEDCLNIFIRRVLEEATESLNSKHLLTSHLVILSDGEVQKINVSTMKFNRLQVLTMLRAAVASDNDIYLDLLLRSSSTMPGLHMTNSNTDRDSTNGFIHIKRNYRLSCKDSSGRVRCFCKTPLESAATGIFFSLTAADKYVEAYGSYAQSLREKAEKKYKEISDAEDEGYPFFGDDPAAMTAHIDLSPFDVLVRKLSDKVNAALADGDVISAAENMLLFQALVCADSKEFSHAMEQLKILLHGKIGYVRAGNHRFHPS
jgi:hypothetical protein